MRNTAMNSRTTLEICRKLARFDEVAESMTRDRLNDDECEWIRKLVHEVYGFYAIVKI